MAFITDEVCADIVLCDPNLIVQDCLPVYEELDCRIAATESVPEWGAYWEKWLNIEGDQGYHDTVDFTIQHVLRVSGEQVDNMNLVHKEGTDANDLYSGLGLLEYISRLNGPAQVESSLYYNDPIHFFFNGGDGDDVLQGANNSDYLNGEGGNDRVYGMGGDDNLTGGDGNDDVFGGDGNDKVSGNAGDDSVRGGEGDDAVKGGTGNDTLKGDEGNDNVMGQVGDDDMYGGDGDDWLSGGIGDDWMNGGNDDDCMSGGQGNDYMLGGKDDDGNDIMLGNLGNDTMLGGGGDDQIEGGEGNDRIYGQEGNDLVSGGNGNDFVHGGDGDDIVRGGFGDDIMYGGDGCDQFVFCEVDYGCFDTIKDFSVLDRDQIDIKDAAVDAVRVLRTGHESKVFLDLMSEGEEVGRILVEAESHRTDLQSVFEVDTAFGTGQGALVQIGAGVMVDLPSTSVLHVEDGMFF